MRFESNPVSSTRLVVPQMHGAADSLTQWITSMHGLMLTCRLLWQDHHAVVCLIHDAKAVTNRYSGMIAWRGVVDGSSHPELLQALIEDYEHLDRGIIFDISSDCCMNLIYLLPGNRINWLWYRDAPEPKLSSHSVTVSATADDIRQLLSDADATWTPAFARLIKVWLYLQSSL